MRKVSELATEALRAYIDAQRSAVKTLITPVFNVKGYGAEGDGTTNDTIKIQDAIDAAEAAGGGMVFFPVGYEYLVATLTVFSPNVSLYSMGAKLKSKTNDTIIHILSTNNIRIDGLDIEGYGNEDDSPVYPGVQNGILIEKSSYVWVENCNISYCLAQGIMISGKETSTQTYDATATHHVYVHSNNVRDCNQNITVFEGAKDVFIDENTSEYAYTWGIGIDDRSTSDTEAHMCERVIVFDNVVRFCGRNGAASQGSIVVTGSKHVLVHHNIITDAGQATYVDDISQTSYAYGIGVTSGQSTNVCTEVQVTDNTIVRCSRQAIVLNGVTRCKVSGNGIFDCGYRTDPAIAQEMIQIAKATLGDSSTQGSNRNIIYGNHMHKAEASANMDYGVKVADSDCASNSIHDEEYWGLATAIVDSGTGTRKEKVYLDGADTATSYTFGDFTIRTTGGVAYIDVAGSIETVLSGALRPNGRLSGVYAGTGSPEGAVTAYVGSIYLREDGGHMRTTYQKYSGLGNTGWIALMPYLTGTVAPTTGAHNQGAIVWNSAPAVAGGAGSQYTIVGWVCTVSGTPGTWVEMRCPTGT